MSAVAPVARARRADVGAPRSVRRALAGLAPAVVAAAGRVGSTTAIEFALVDALASASGSLRASIALASDTSAALALVAMSGQTVLDPRRRMNRRLVERLEATRALQPDRLGVRRCVHDDDSVPQRSIACATLVIIEPDGAAIGVAFERTATEPFSLIELDLLAAALRDPIALLQRLRRVELPWYRRAPKTLRRLASDRVAASERLALTGQVLGTRAARVSIGALALALVCALPVPLVITARASIEAEDRQIVAAADDGYLLSAHARAGDTVRAGQVLARLDDRDVLLAQDSWQAEAARNAEELSRAVALRDRAALGELRADAKRIAVELAGAKRRVERSQLLAPFDAVILEGDPGRRLGAPVEAGEVLFELASSERYRLMLQIEEADVRFVQAGMDARVRMAGLPDTVWPATLDALLPVAVAEPGTNIYRMPAALDGELSSLRPGMQGVARIGVGNRALIWVLTRGLRERLVLLAWRLGLVG